MELNDNAEIVSETYSIISGSSENSRYHGIFASVPVMEGTKSTEISPIIPVQAITIESLQEIWNNVNFKNKDEVLSHDKMKSIFFNYENSIDSTENPNPNRTLSEETSERAENSTTENFEPNDESIQLHTIGESLNQVFSSSAPLEPRCQENAMLLEDSQVDLFDSERIISFEGTSKEIDVKFSNEFPCGEGPHNSLSSKDTHYFSQPLICDQDNETRTEMFPCGKLTSSMIQHEPFSGTSPEKESQAASLPLNTSAVSDSNIFKSCMQTEPVDNAVNSHSLCTCPQNISNDGEHLCLISLNTNKRNERVLAQTQIVNPYIAKSEINLPSDKTNDDSDASICTVPPDAVTYIDQSSSKNHDAWSQNKFELISTSGKKETLSKNQDFVYLSPSKDKGRLLYQEQMGLKEQETNKRDQLCLSQGTKSSSDMFLSFTKVSDPKESSQDLQATIGKRTNLGPYGKDTRPDRNSEDKHDEPLPSLQEPHLSKDKSERKYFTGNSIVGKKNNSQELVSQLEKCGGTINKDHQRKMMSLQRFENLCSQIVSRLDDMNCTNKNPFDMESYILRCEDLITKMHAMQKEEKAKLCSSLSGTNISKQKKKMLKIQLEHLKSRHQTLMDIVNKYGEIKGRFTGKGFRSSQKSSLPSNNSSEAQQLSTNDSDADILNEIPEFNDQSKIFRDNKNIDKKIAQNTLKPIVSTMECMEENRCTKITQESDDILVISGSNNKENSSTVAILEEQMERIASDTCKSAYEIHDIARKDNDIIRKSNLPSNNVLDNGIVITSSKDVAFQKININSDKKHISTESKRNKMDVSHSEKYSTQTISLPFKRKLASKYNPPVKTKSVGMICSDKSIEFDIPMKSVQNDYSCKKESSVYVDDILFTEFPYPSLEMNDTRVVTNPNGETTNKSERKTVVFVQDDIITKECTQLPLTNMGKHDYINQSKVFNNMHEIKYSFTSNPKTDQTFEHDDRITKDYNYYNVHEKGFGTGNTIPLRRKLSSTLNSAATTENYDCTESTSKSPLNYLCKPTTYLPLKGVPNEYAFSQHEPPSLSQPVAEIAIHSITSTQPFANDDENTRKDVSNLPIYNKLIHSDGLISKTVNNNVNKFNTARKLSDEHKDQMKTKPSTSEQLQCPTSPHPTNESSIFPVLSKEIIKSVQSQQLPQETENHNIKATANRPSQTCIVISKESKYHSPIHSPTSILPPEHFSKVKESIPQNSADNLILPYIVAERSIPIPTQKPTGPSSPCSTQGSSLFPVSSREIIRRVQNRKPLSQPLTTPMSNVDTKCVLKMSTNNTSDANISLSKMPLLTTTTISHISSPTIQSLNPKTSGQTHLNLEPSAASLNTIMTSSLCLPERQNNSKESSKTKRGRKPKPKTESQFTQTSPDILMHDDSSNVDNRKSRNDHFSNSTLTASNSYLCGTTYISVMNNKHLINSNQEKPINCSVAGVTNTKSDSDYYKSKIVFQEFSSVYSIINGLRTIQLIADQELIPPYRGGMDSKFWDEDFAQITMSKSMWDTVVDW